MYLSRVNPQGWNRQDKIRLRIGVRPNLYAWYPGLVPHLLCAKKAMFSFLILENTPWQEWQLWCSSVYVPSQLSQEHGCKCSKWERSKNWDSRTRAHHANGQVKNCLPACKLSRNSTESTASTVSFHRLSCSCFVDYPRTISSFNVRWIEESPVEDLFVLNRGVLPCEVLFHASFHQSLPWSSVLSVRPDSRSYCLDTRNSNHMSRDRTLI